MLTLLVVFISVVGSGRSESAEATAADACSTATAAPTVVTGDPSAFTFADQGIDRRYVVWPAQPNAPVLLLFHGWSSTPERVAASSGLPARAAAAGWTVVAPQGSGDPARWAIPDHLDGPDDVAFVDALLTDVRRQVCVDTSRVAAAGFSNGAAFTALLSCHRHLEAIAMVSGANLITGCPAEETPAVIAHGTDDRVVRTDGGPVLDGRLAAKPLAETVDQWRSSRAALTTVIVPGGGHTWPQGTTEAVLATFAP